MKDDLISRSAAIDTIDELYVGKTQFTVTYDEVNTAFKAVIRSLPSAQPERKKGHWVEIGDEPYDKWECDVCGFVIDGSGCIDPEEYRDVYRFCPNCGARMEGTP